MKAKKLISVMYIRDRKRITDTINKHYNYYISNKLSAIKKKLNKRIRWKKIKIVTIKTNHQKG